MIRVLIPTLLQPVVEGRRELAATGTTVGEVIARLADQHPELGAKLLDDKGQVQSYVNLFLDGEDVRFLRGLDTPVGDDAELAIVPAVAGGSSSDRTRRGIR